MLARRSIALGRAACPASPSAPAGARNMATLREIEMRLKSVRNIEKITKVCGLLFLDVSFRSHCRRSLPVHEVDRVDKTQQGAARFAGGQGVRYRELWCVAELSQYHARPGLNSR